jgi:hypothetical protein
MTDIRRTVGLLDAGPTGSSSPKTTPEPGITDIPDLIDDFLQAGLTVTLRMEGPTERVSATVGWRFTASLRNHWPRSQNMHRHRKRLSTR